MPLRVLEIPHSHSPISLTLLKIARFGQYIQGFRNSMLAIRRASVHLKSRVLSSWTSRCRYENCNAEIIESQRKLMDTLLCSRRFCNTFVPSKSYSKAHAFCSQAGVSGDEMDDESVFESELVLDDTFADDEQNESESLDTKADAGKEKSRRIKAPSSMTKAILADTRLTMRNIMKKWVEDGNKATLAEVYVNILYFRKRKMYSQALQLSEWLEESSKLIAFSNYASRVDLIAKVRGIVEAEKYIKHQIPKRLKTEVVYRALLANCVDAVDVKKSEELFSKMKGLFPISTFSCDQMLLLYKRTIRKKIADILSLMKKENIKRSVFTYQTLIDAKWESGHISGMERILEEMKSDGLEPSMHILASVAKHYVSGGLKGKAEGVLKTMEGGDLTENRWVCRFLLPIYASLQRADEVERIWKYCEMNPDFAECVAGIQAWGRLNRIEEAEAVFDKFLRIVKRPSSRHYAYMLNMYADHKMLAKGEDLVRQMTESGVKVMPPAWHALVKLYALAGEVEKAESALQKALTDRRGMQLISSFLSIIDAYAEKGDIQNAEKIFVKMKRTGFTPSIRSYRSLLYAYVNAKDPAYGFRERMESDNVVVDQKVSALLHRVADFAKPATTATASWSKDVLP